MGQELAGKVAVITGAANGIGAGMAELFVSEGASVVIADVDESNGQALVSKLGAATRFHRCDVSARDDLEAVVKFATSEFGGLHIMVNNAGISEVVRPFMEDDLPNFGSIINTDLLGVLLGTQVAARHMRKAGGGSIINISSLAAMNPGIGHTSYRAAKVAVNHFTQSVAIELGKDLVRVNCVCPGNIITGMGTYASPGVDIPADVLDAMRDRIKAVRMSVQPLKVQGTPMDIGQAAVFLGSDRSRYVTGVILPVDGGLAAGTLGLDVPAEVARLKAEAVAHAKRSA